MKEKKENRDKKGNRSVGCERERIKKNKGQKRKRCVILFFLIFILIV